MNEIWYDFAYPGVDLAGCVGVVRYLPTNNGSTRSKYDLTSAEIDQLHGRGLPVAAFWQDGASSALLGYDRGVQDAQRAEAAMDALGGNDVWVSHYAVDANVTYAQVAPYFQGILDTAKRPVGAYGSYAVCEGLYAELGIQWLIQTSSWSWVTNPDGTKTLQISPHAWLLQRDHNVVSGTSKVDVDVQLLPFYNAWRPSVATPMTPSQREAAFRAEGLTLVGVRQWWTNDRAPVTGLPAGPKNGLTIHHTGGETSDPLRYASTILYDGRSDLPGPLAHDGLDIYKGVIYMVGTGRTNHAGKGDSNVLAQVVADTLPYDRELHPTLNDIDGNARYYGLEMMYDGTHPLPRVGWVAMIKWAAAICRFHGWSASAIAHREHTNTKPDPGYVDLAAVRRDVRDCLALPPGVWGATTQEDDMFEENDRKNLNYITTLIQWGFDWTPDFKGAVYGEQGEITQRIRRSEDLLKSQAAAITALTQLVGQITSNPDVTPEAVKAMVEEAVNTKFAEGIEVSGVLIPKELEAAQLQQRQDSEVAPSAPPEGADYTDLPDCSDPDDPANK